MYLTKFSTMKLFFEYSWLIVLWLQIPFEELAGSRGSSQPHTLVPANLLLTTVQSLAPSTGQAPLSTHHQATQSPLSSGHTLLPPCTLKQHHTSCCAPGIVALFSSAV